MCEETKAALRHQLANAVGTGAAVLPAVQPGKASHNGTKPRKMVFNVYKSNKSSSSEADSCDSLSYGGLVANGKENLGNKFQKRARMKEVIYSSDESGSDEQK
jgi:hypothetical protein